MKETDTTVNDDPVFASNPNYKRKICMLMVTHSCNLNCSYCYEKFKSDINMDVDLAKSIISKEAQCVLNSSQFEEMQVDFMGGEPLVNFSLIKEIVEWLETGAIPVPWICFASTNGTLLTEERKEWFRKHKTSICLGTSYDGTESMQQKNRKSKQNSIDLAFMHELWPLQPFKMTVSKETLPNLAEGYIEMQRNGYPVEVSLAQGVEWSIDDARLYKEQLTLLMNASLNDSSIKPMNRLTRLLSIRDTYSESEGLSKYCGTGTGMITYDVDGQTYGCHLFSPIVLGKERAEISKAIDWNDPLIMSHPVCNRCLLRCWCSTCCGYNYKDRGAVNKRDMHWCGMLLAEAFVACEYQLSLLSSKTELSSVEAEHAKAILCAYNVLQGFDGKLTEGPYLQPN